MSNTVKAILIAFAIFTGYKLLQKFGLIKTAEESKQEANIKTATGSKRNAKGKEENPFNPLYVKGLIKSGAGKKVKLLPQAQINAFVTSVYDSKGYFKDNDSAVVSIFKKMETKSQVSQVSEAFSKKYGQDMATYLKFMDDENYNSVIETVNQMPTGLI